MFSSAAGVSQTDVLPTFVYQYGQPSHVLCFGDSYQKIPALKLSEFAATSLPFTITVVPGYGEANEDKNDRIGPRFLVNYSASLFFTLNKANSIKIFNMAVYSKDYVDAVSFNFIPYIL
jgi:hypothetical protein